MLKVENVKGIQNVKGTKCKRYKLSTFGTILACLARPNTPKGSKMFAFCILLAYLARHEDQKCSH